MKTLLPFLTVLTVLAFTSAPSLVRAQDAPPPPGDQGDQSDQGDQGASFQTFYDQLGDQGDWIQTDDYGYVFQPNVSDPDWAPYTDGHWVYTDVGWMWVSDEPWGWATYHYGRWVNIDGTGWVWVPGNRWAPAWVSWRYGGGYCGWAPLPPETLVGVGIGFHFGGDVDVSFNIGPGYYNFVRVGDMGEPNYRGRYLDRSRNFTVINNTTNITNINTAGGRSGANFQGVVAKGPPLSEINAHSHQHIPTVQLTAATQAGQSRLQGNSLAVYAPRGNGASTQNARPAKVSQSISHPTFNRGDSVTAPLAVTATVKPPAPSASAIQAAQTAQLHAPANAKIATEKTTVKPLTSLAPATQNHQTANAVNPNTEHSAANAPFTGEPANKPAVTQPNEVKPAATYRPQTETPPATTYRSQTETPPATTYRPQTETPPSQTYRPQTETPPATTYRPQTETPPATTYRPQTETPPATTYRPQTETPPATTYRPQTETPPATTYRPQNVVSPQTESKPPPPPPSHPQQQAQPQQPARPPPPAYKPGNTNNAPGH